MVAAQINHQISPESVAAIDLECNWLEWKAPNWKENNRVHNWKNYAPAELIEIWDTFDDYQKKVIAVALDRVASDEHWD